MRPPPLQRQPNGDLLVSCQAARYLISELRELHVLLGGEHGRQIEDPARVETKQETSFRQDSVNRLSAAVGIEATLVQEEFMPSTSHTVNHSDTLEKIDRLCDWFEGVS